MEIDLTHVVAVLLSLGAALALASNYLFVRMGTDGGKAHDAVLIVMLTNVVVLLPLVAIVYYPEYGLTRRSWASFVAAGVLGTLLGRICLYTSIDKIGASRTTPIVASWALVSSVLGIIVLGEDLTKIHGIGIALIVSGVAAIAWETSHENPDDLSRRDLWLGLSIPFGAALAYGWEPIYASLGLAEGTPAPVGLLVKTIAAVLGFASYLWWRDSLPAIAEYRLNSVRWFLLAGVANTLFLLGYYLALEITLVSIVTPIIVTNTLFVVLLSAVFMPERLERVTWQIGVAATLVVSGVVIITVYA